MIGTVAPDVQDELIYTPEIELSTVDAASVTFWSMGYGSLQVDHGTVITVEVSTDPGKGAWDVLWTYPEPEWTLGYHWYEKTVDLSAYVGDKIYLGWRYTFDGVSAGQGKMYYLDDILVQGNCTGCAISGLCYADGEFNPGNACQVCDVANTNTAWTPVTAGTTCNDGLFCTVDDLCDDAGNCDGVARNCSDDLFCTGVEFCYEAGDMCVSPGDPCDESETCNEEAGTCDLPGDDDITDDDVSDDDATDDDQVDDDSEDDADDDDDDQLDPIKDQDDGGCGC